MRELYNTYGTIMPQALTNQAAQYDIYHMYNTHIAALYSGPPTAWKKAFHKKLLKGPDATIFEHPKANNWGRLLEHRVRRYWPENEII